MGYGYEPNIHKIKGQNLNTLKITPLFVLKGYKIGLNGVDNAALWFDKVRVPRLNLLNATSNMDENGNFTSTVRTTHPSK